MKKLWRWIVIIGLVLFLAWLFYQPLLTLLAERLVVSDPLTKADLILVLGGDGNGERVAAAVKLYQQGYAPRLLMSGGPLAWQLTYADWMKKQALVSGVPAAAIILEGKSRSTIDNALFSLPLAEARGSKAVIVVTSPYHTRRAAKVFRKVFGSRGIKTLIFAAPSTEYNPQRWWTRHEDTGLVVWEYVSLVLYFLKGY